MLDKFNQVYAKLISESNKSKKTSLKNILKENKKSSKIKTLTLMFESTEGGEGEDEENPECKVTCRAAGCDTVGCGGSNTEALQDFCKKFDGEGLACEDEGEVINDNPDEDDEDADDGENCK